LATTPQLRRLGLAFNELLAARERAGYSPEPRSNFQEGTNNAPSTREETLTLIELAVEAIQLLEGLGEDARLRLATRLVARTRK
jgi:hypothetical protein